MSAHRYSSDARQSYAIGAGVRNISEGDTIDLAGKDGLVFEVAGAGGSAVVLPAEEVVPVGVTVLISNTGAGTLTVNNDAAGTVATQLTGASREYLLSEDDSGPVWISVLF